MSLKPVKQADKQVATGRQSFTYRIWYQDSSIVATTPTEWTWHWEVVAARGEVIASGTAPGMVAAKAAALRFCLEQESPLQLANPRGLWAKYKRWKVPAHPA